MKCPDCGSALTGVPLGPAGETNQSYRCMRCGGFFLNGWLANRVRAVDLEDWPGVNVDGSFISMSSDDCPNDGTKIEDFKGDNVPADVVVKHCPKCGWFWFPANNLFKFKPAQEAKVSYFKLWGKVADMSALLLPVMAVAVLIVGTVASVNLIRSRQNTQISATETIKNIRIVSVGPQEAVVTFQTKAQSAVVEYRLVGENTFAQVPAEVAGGWGSVKIAGLVNGGDYRFVVESGGVKSEEIPFRMGN